MNLKPGTRTFDTLAVGVLIQRLPDPTFDPRQFLAQLGYTPAGADAMIRRAMPTVQRIAAALAGWPGNTWRRPILRTRKETNR